MTEGRGQHHPTSPDLETLHTSHDDTTPWPHGSKHRASLRPAPLLRRGRDDRGRGIRSSRDDRGRRYGGFGGRDDRGRDDRGRGRRNHRHLVGCRRGRRGSANRAASRGARWHPRGPATRRVNSRGRAGRGIHAVRAYRFHRLPPPLVIVPGPVGRGGVIEFAAIGGRVARTEGRSQRQARHGKEEREEFHPATAPESREIVNGPTQGNLSFAQPSPILPGCLVQPNAFRTSARLVP